MPGARAANSGANQAPERISELNSVARYIANMYDLFHNGAVANASPAIDVVDLLQNSGKKYPGPIKYLEDPEVLPEDELPMAVGAQAGAVPQQNVQSQQ